MWLEEKLVKNSFMISGWETMAWVYDCAYNVELGHKSLFCTGIINDIRPSSAKIARALASPSFTFHDFRTFTRLMTKTMHFASTFEYI